MMLDSAEEEAIADDDDVSSSNGGVSRTLLQRGRSVSDGRVVNINNDDGKIDHDCYYDCYYSIVITLIIFYYFHLLKIKLRLKCLSWRVN